MKTRPFIYLTFVIFLLVNCGKNTEEVKPDNAPEACISAIEETIYAGMPVSFSAKCSKNAVSFHWDLGDGSVSKDSVVTHTYKDAGSYTVTFKVGNESDLTDEVTLKITVQEAKAIPVFYHSSNITQDQVWQYGIHIISWSIDIGATVTIMPGSVIKFKEDVGLVIIENGAIIANGTETKPILFTANTSTPQPGYYYGIRLKNGLTAKSSFTHCTFEYGGGWYGYGAVVEVSNTDVEFSGNIIQHTKDLGLEIADGGDVRNFNNNTFTDCGGYSLKINGNAVQNYGENNKLDTDDKGILISSAINRPSVRWHKLSVPYIVPSTMRVGSTTGTTFIIDPGVTILCGDIFEFAVDFGLKCKLIAEGTQQDKIIFTSLEDNKQKGDWRGLQFGSGLDTTSSLKYCIIEYPDFVNSTSAAIEMNYTSLNINNCEINHVDIGVYCNQSSYFQSFANNIITADKDGLIMNPNMIPTISNLNTINAPVGVEVIDAFITRDVTWPKFTYFINTFLYIEAVNGCGLTLLPGTKLKIMNGRAIFVGRSTTKPGGLKALGSPENPIVFTSQRNVPVAGDWEHISFGQGTLPGSAMDNCIVEYAGAMLYKGAISIENTKVPTIQNTTIRYSADFGIVSNKGSSSFSGNVFQNNAKADYNIIP